MVYFLGFVEKIVDVFPLRFQLSLPRSTGPGLICRVIESQPSGDLMAYLINALTISSMVDERLGLI